MHTTTAHSTRKPRAAKRPNPGRRLEILRQRLRHLVTLDPNAIVTSGDIALAADELIENCIGAFPVPFGVAGPIAVNGKGGRLIAMATEERTVVAACSKGATMLLDSVTVDVGPAIMPAHVAFSGVKGIRHLERLSRTLKKHRERVLSDALSLLMHKCRGSVMAEIDTPKFIPLPAVDGLPGDMLMVIDLRVHAGEHMGAGLATWLAEYVGREYAKLVDIGKTAAICANYRAGHSVSAKATFTVPEGRSRRDTIITMNRWAHADPERAATHQKGIANAIDAIALATGQDVRAIGAANGAAKQALARTRFVPLGDDRVLAELLLNVPVGTVGGATQHPAAVFGRQVMGIRNAADLAAMMAAAGLVQNFAALHALTGEGIIASGKAVREPRTTFLGEPLTPPRRRRG